MKTRMSSCAFVLFAALSMFMGLGGCGGGSSSSDSTSGIVWHDPYGDGNEWLTYNKIGNTVFLKGGASAIKGDLDPSMKFVQEGQIVCTLPEGFRPPGPGSIFLLCPTWGWPIVHGDEGYIGTAGISIFPDGTINVKTVQQFNGEQQFLIFDGLSFSTVSGEGGWSNDGIVWAYPYTPSGPTPSTLQYIKTGTTVTLQGSANAGGTFVQEGQIIGTLPAGVRPPATHGAWLLCPTWGWPTGHVDDGYIGTAGVIIQPDGSIEVKTVGEFEGEQQYLMFDGLSFSTVMGADGWSSDGITWTAPYALSDPYPSTLEVKSDEDMVVMRGLANAGGTNVQEGQTIGTLPAGFRPPAGYTRTFLCPTWGWPTGHGSDGYIGTAGVKVFSDGSIRVKTVQQFEGEQQFLAFDGKQFSTLE